MPGSRKRQQQDPPRCLAVADRDEELRPFDSMPGPQHASSQLLALSTSQRGKSPTTLQPAAFCQQPIGDETDDPRAGVSKEQQQQRQPLMPKQCAKTPSDAAVFNHGTNKLTTYACTATYAAAGAQGAAAALQHPAAIGEKLQQQCTSIHIAEAQLGIPALAVELCSRKEATEAADSARLLENQRLLPTKKRSVLDGEDDVQDSWMEKLSAHPAVVRMSRLTGRVMQSQAVAVLFDISDVLLFALDMYTDARVVQAMSDAGYYGWMTANIVFMTWHFVLMAVLMSMYARRTTTKWTVLGVGSDVFKAGLWVLFIPLALPVVVVLDVLMLFTSTAPIFFPQFFASFSSFMANYNFTRLFVEFLFESVPQTILQTYIYYHLLAMSTDYPGGAAGDMAGSNSTVTASTVAVVMMSPMPAHARQTEHHVTALSTSERAQQAVVASLVISSLNTCKFAFKLWKAAGDAGLRMHQYLKYLLLLKGNYECPPATMAAVLQQCCTYKNGVFTMNGLPLHREKARYGPAQQAFILLNAFQRCPTRKGVTRWVCAGCPLASTNRILEQGIKSFRNLEALELAECAVRGDTLPLVLRAIKKHTALAKVKMVQTGILSKYRNTQRDEWAQLLKPSCGLTHFAVCAAWWGEAAMMAAAQHAVGHPYLQSLAIEFPVLQHVEDEEGAHNGFAASKHFKGMAAAMQLAKEAGQAGNMVGAAAGSAAAAVAAVGGVLTAATDLLVDTSGSLKRLVGLSHKQRGPLVTAAYMSATACMLRGAPALTCLALHRHIFNQEGCAMLASALQQAGSRLTSLSLSGSRLGGDAAADALGKALARAPAVTQLCVRGCGLSGDALARLLAGLQQAGSIRDLDISGNTVNAATLEGAARLLRHCTQLIQLHLQEWGTALQQADMHAATHTFFDGVAASCSVQHLSFAGTALGQRGMAGLIHALGCGTCPLRTLEMSQVEKAAIGLLVPDACWLPFAQALPAACSMTSLNLAGNPISACGCAALADALPQCLSLTHINLSRTGISDMQLAVLAEGLQAMPALHALSLSGVGPLQARAVHALARLLQPTQPPPTHSNERPGMHPGLDLSQHAVEHAHTNWAIPAAGGPCDHEHASTNAEQGRQQAAVSCQLRHLDLSFADFGGLRHAGHGAHSSRGGSHVLTSLPSPTSQPSIACFPHQRDTQVPLRSRLSTAGSSSVVHDSSPALGVAAAPVASLQQNPSESAAHLLSAAAGADAVLGPGRPIPAQGAADGLIQILADAVAYSNHLEQLNLAHTALPDAAVWSLGAAVSGGSCILQSLDLSGCSESVVRPAFSLILDVHSSSQQRQEPSKCRLQCLTCTAADGSFNVIDLLSSSMAT